MSIYVCVLGGTMHLFVALFLLSILLLSSLCNNIYDFHRTNNYLHIVSGPQLEFNLAYEKV